MSHAGGSKGNLVSLKGHKDTMKENELRIYMKAPAFPRGDKLETHLTGETKTARTTLMPRTRAREIIA